MGSQKIKKRCFIGLGIILILAVGICIGVVLRLQQTNDAHGKPKDRKANVDEKGDFAIVIRFPAMLWVLQYEDTGSKKFQSMQQKIENEFGSAFNASFLRNVVNNTIVEKLRKGSVVAHLSLTVNKLSFTLFDASNNVVEVNLQAVDVLRAIQEGAKTVINDDPASIFTQANMSSIQVEKTTEKQDEIKEECLSKTDVMFLLDESGSIGGTNFDTLKLFVSEFASSSDISENAIQMGVVTFNSYATSQFKLNDYQSAGQIVMAMNEVKYSSGGTDIASGLQFVYDSSYKTENGGRTDAFKVLVLMTDGESSDASYTAGLLKNTGVTIICIGIGSGIEINHLKSIASQESLVFYASDFNALSNVRNITLQRSCDANYTEFGDINKLKPTGKKNGGVSSSEADVKYDVTEIMKRKSCYVSAGRANGLHPALLAAIASRESRAGRLLYKTNGWGDNSNAYGILQCDKNACPVCTYGFNCTSYPWDSCEHIRMMTQYVVVPFIQQVQKKHPNWLPEQQLQGGVAAYNFGVKNVRSWGNLDKGTTGNDYSNDIIARAQYLINNYQW